MGGMIIARCVQLEFEKKGLSEGGVSRSERMGAFKAYFGGLRDEGQQHKGLQLGTWPATSEFDKEPELAAAKEVVKQVAVRFDAAWKRHKSAQPKTKKKKP